MFKYTFFFIFLFSSLVCDFVFTMCVVAPEKPSNYALI